VKSLLNALVLFATITTLKAGPILAAAAISSEVPAQAIQPDPPPIAQPTNPPPAPPAMLPAPPKAEAQQGATDSGQWVYTSQYGWVWMPYGNSYTYAPPNDSTPSMYVYYPTSGWCWVIAPWLVGWGPAPYFGPIGYGYYGWYGRGMGHWYGFSRGYGRYGQGPGGPRGGGSYRGEGGAGHAPRASAPQSQSGTGIRSGFSLRNLTVGTHGQTRSQDTSGRHR